MSAAVQAVVYIVATMYWDSQPLWGLSDGRMVAKRTSPSWFQAECATRQTRDDHGIPDGERCHDIVGCDECHVSWWSQRPEQGTVSQWARNMQYSHEAELRGLRYELEELRRNSIEIAKVQQVGHDYAVHQEWCGVYEEAFEALGIEPLSVSSDIEVTITVHATVNAGRRQRVDDTDFMEQSLVTRRIESALSDVDYFDHDYTLESNEVVNVSISLR